MTSASRTDRPGPATPGRSARVASAGPDAVRADPDVERGADGAVAEPDIGRGSDGAVAGRGKPAATRAASRAEQAARDRQRAKRREPKRWKPRRPVAGLALMFAMFGLSMSWFMPWAAPASLLGVILGGVAIGRRDDDRATGGWALGLGLAGLAGSAFWAFWIWHGLTAGAA